MNCLQFELRIHDLLDERRQLRNDEQLAAHSAQCLTCQRKLCDFELLESYFDPTAMVNVKSWVALKRIPAQPQRHWVIVAVAATLLAMFVPFLNPLRQDPTTQLADSSRSHSTHDGASSNSSERPIELSWPEMLATIEALPQHLETLGPVYSCTAHMTGVSSLTSSWNLTVDWLRSRPNNYVVPNDGADCAPAGRFELGNCERLA